MALPVPPVPPTDQLPSSGGDQLSPTTLILNYLRSQGTPINPENIRRGVEAAARGDVSGLRSDRPATEAEDQAAMAAAKGGRSGGSGPSSSAQPDAGNPPPANLGKVPGADEPPITGPLTGGGTKRTAGAYDDGGLGSTILAALTGAGGAGLATYLGMRGGRGIPGSPDAVAEDVSPTTKAAMGEVTAPAVSSAPTGMESAMVKATAPAAPNVSPPGAEMGPQPEIPFNSAGPRVPPPEPFVRQSAPGLTLGPQPAPEVPFNRPAGGGPKTAPAEMIVRPNTRPAMSVRPNVGPAADALEALARLKSLRP